MSFLESLFGKPKESNKDAENAARAEALRQQKLNTESFVAGGAPVYDQGQQYYFNELGQLEQLRPSEMQNIQTDPRLIQAQYDALRELETRGREGFTARDELDRLKTKQDVAKENAGRLGAIQQNMAARGMGGSGMDLVAQLQASQAATEREALAGLERNAAQEANRANSSAQAGGLAGNIRGQGFQENSAKAQAQDAINRFNTANSVNRSMYNNRGLNEVGQQNVGRYNQTMDKNTDARYGFRKDAYGIQNNQYNQNYNAATEDLNQKRIQDEQARARKQAQISGITTLAGAGIGAATAGPGGAMKGAQMGAGIGNAAGGAFYAHGGTVKGKDCYASGGMIPGEEILPWDDTANDTVQINASPGEIVIPKSIANDPLASAQFVDRENRKQMQAARSQQDIAGLGNILGKAATDYGNAQNQGVVLANRMQDLGQKPSMYQTEKRQFDSSVLDNLGKQGVNRASEDAMRNEKAQARDMQLKQMAGINDPSSPESVAAREYLKRVAPQLASTPGFERLTADKVSKIAPSYQNLYKMDQDALNRKEIRAGQMAQDAARREEMALRKYESDQRFDLTRGDRLREQELGRAEKEKAASEKKMATMYEIEDRRKNILDNLKLLNDQIDEYGTYEMFGPQNENMNRRIENIATDMAKLSDPSSVARPSEVEGFKKGLIEAGIGKSNSTAKQILKDFESEVQSRANNAYKIRGVEMPNQSTSSEETKVIDGKKFKKVNGGWEEVG
jgi:hypothetical protein